VSAYVECCSCGNPADADNVVCATCEERERRECGSEVQRLRDLLLRVLASKPASDSLLEEIRCELRYDECPSCGSREAEVMRDPCSLNKGEHNGWHDGE